MGGIKTRDSIDDIISDLIVIDFQADDLPARISEWKRSTIAPYAQNCRRNLYYGFSEDFKNFPYDELDRSYSDLGGIDAYAHIMKFASGFERGRYNSHNRSQFFEAWAQSIKKHPETAEKYGTLLHYINSDTRFMHQHITSKYKPHRTEISARDLSGMSKGDDIFIIGSLGGNGDLSHLTSGIIRVAESKQKGRKGFITLTHPDSDTLNIMQEAINGHEGRGNIRSGIQFAEFNDLALAFEVSDRAFITMPMAIDEEADISIIDAWKNRSNRNNTLTHMKGDVSRQGSMTNLWKHARLDNFINPYNIREDMADRSAFNAEVIVKAERAFWQCANLRYQGLPIHKQDFFERSPDLIIE